MRRHDLIEENRRIEEEEQGHRLENANRESE